MADKQYDVPEEIQRLYKIKQQRLEENRKYYRKLMTNPHRPVGLPFPFDPVMHRFNSLTTYASEHFRPTPKSILLGIAYLVLPGFAIYYGVKYERTSREDKFRNGQVRYEDRENKMIY